MTTAYPGKLHTPIVTPIDKSSAGVLDTILQVNHEEIIVNNAKSFYDGQVAHVFPEGRLDGPSRGSVKILKTFPKQRILLIDGPIPAGTGVGDLLVVDGLPDAIWNEAEQCWKVPSEAAEASNVCSVRGEATEVQSESASKVKDAGGQ